MAEHKAQTISKDTDFGISLVRLDDVVVKYFANIHQINGISVVDRNRMKLKNIEP